MTYLCPHCMGDMKILFNVSYYCPNDCDRRGGPPGPKEYFRISKGDSLGTVTWVFYRYESMRDVPESPWIWTRGFSLLGDTGDRDDPGTPVEKQVALWTKRLAGGYDLGWDAPSRRRVLDKHGENASYGILLLRKIVTP